jgi:hypothetical protein
MKRVISALAGVCLLAGSAISQEPKNPAPPKPAPAQPEKPDAATREKELHSAAEAGDALSAIILLLQQRMEKQQKLGRMPGTTSQADELEAVVLQLAAELRELRSRIDRLDKGVRP